MKKIYLLIVSCFLYSLLLAQKNGVVKGIAFDTLSKQPVLSATITLLQKKDSSLVSFTMTDNKGQFEITGLSNGEYRLLTTHMFGEVLVPGNMILFPTWSKRPVFQESWAVYTTSLHRMSLLKLQEN